jgi:hypothetical protein
VKDNERRDVKWVVAAFVVAIIAIVVVTIVFG